MRKEVEERIVRAIEEKVFPGCVIGILKNDAREIQRFGNFTYEPDSQQVTEDTVYDLASVTKSIPTASLAATYIAEGKLSVSDTVKTYIPELQNDFGATIEDLLRYRAQGLRLSKLNLATFEEIRTHVFEKGFSSPPGESVYTNLPAYVLGVVLERVGDKSIATQAHERFFGSLKMENTTFFPAKSLCAPTEIDSRGTVQGLPHDESAYLFAIKRRSVGHAGLFSTASDLLAFLQALLLGKYPAVVEAAQKGLGWQMNDSNFMGQYAGSKAFGKTGFTGTSIMCDVDRRLALVILSNRTYPKRPQDQSAISAFRRDITDLILGSA